MYKIMATPCYKMALSETQTELDLVRFFLKSLTLMQKVKKQFCCHLWSSWPVLRFLIIIVGNF